MKFNLPAVSFIMVAVLLGTTSAGRSLRGSNDIPNFDRTPNAAISGYNRKHLSGVSPTDCANECTSGESASWCVSFDYDKDHNKCDLSDKRANNVGGLKTNYAGNPYDHYSLQTNPDKPFADFCWKDTYTRGPGRLPGRVADCPSGYTNNGLTCGRGSDEIYSPSKTATCPSGYVNHSVFGCHRPYSTANKLDTCGIFNIPCGGCPRGYYDAGLFCARDAHNTHAFTCPAGYSLIGDTGFCKPSCPAGYSYTLESCHRPVSTLGYESSGCKANEEKIFSLFHSRCVPKTGSCNANEEEDFGLCYPKCQPGYTGVGPVCWGDVPSDWVDCGMGAASSDTECALAVTDQVMSVGEVAFNIATAGSGSAASQNFDTVTDGVRTAAKNNGKFKKALETSIEVYGKAADSYSLYEIFTRDDIPMEPEDKVRANLELISLFDPSGVTGLVAAYTYPTCSAYFTA